MLNEIATTAVGDLAVLATDHHDGPPWPFFIFLWVALAAIVAIVVTRRRSCGPRHGTAVLAERYARGEIDADEYRTRREELRKR
jgi:putative membrane protein